MIIENFGTGKRCEQTLRLLLSAEAEGRLPDRIKRCILLPIPTSRDRIHLSGTDKLLTEVFADAREGDLIVGYGIDEEIGQMLKARGALIYDALCDDEFLIENARQTAEGALGYILSSTDKAPRDTVFAVVGYGRIGSALVRLLLFLGAKVKVYTGRPLTSISLGECGLEAHLLMRGAPLPDVDADIIINTAPTDLSASFKGGRLPKGTRLIELASGENFKGIEGVERLPGIPDKYFGRSAGKNYFDCIMNFIREVTK